MILHYPFIFPAVMPFGFYGHTTIPFGVMLNFSPLLAISLTMRQSKTNPIEKDHGIIITVTNTSTSPVCYANLIPLANRSGPNFSNGRFAYTQSLYKCSHNMSAVGAHMTVKKSIQGIVVTKAVILGLVMLAQDLKRTRFLQLEMNFDNNSYQFINYVQVPNG